jgi:hypothetical protein
MQKLDPPELATGMTATENRRLTLDRLKPSGTKPF